MCGGYYSDAIVRVTPLSWLHADAARAEGSSAVGCGDFPALVFAAGVSVTDAMMVAATVYFAASRPL